MRFFFCLAIFLTAHALLTAQAVVWDKEALTVVQQCRRLVVVLPDPGKLPDDPKLRKNKAWVKVYEAHITGLQATLRSQVSEHWKLTPQVDYLLPFELEGYRTKASEQERLETLVLHLPSVETNFLLATQKLGKSKLERFNTATARLKTDVLQPVFLHRLPYVTRFDEFSVYAGPSFAAAAFYGNQPFVSASELAFALENMQDLLRKSASGGCMEPFCTTLNPFDKNKRALKTLLIPREFVENGKNGKRTVSDAEINETYAGPWKVATWQEIDEAVAKKDATKAVVFSTVFPTAGPHYGTCFWVVDAADARTLLAYSTPGTEPDGRDLTLWRIQAFQAP